MGALNVAPCGWGGHVNRLENPVIRAKFRDIIQAKILADEIHDISDVGLETALEGTVMPDILLRYAILLRDAGELEAAQP